MRQYCHLSFWTIVLKLYTEEEDGFDYQDEELKGGRPRRHTSRGAEMSRRECTGVPGET